MEGRLHARVLESSWARAIIYRPFVRKILESNFNNPEFDETFDSKIVRYAAKGIQALIRRDGYVPLEYCICTVTDALSGCS